MTIPHPGIPDNTIKLRQQPVSGYPRKVLAVKSCPNRGQICLALCKGKGKAKQLIHPGETCWGHAFTGCCKMSAAFSERMHHPSPVLWPFPPPSRGKGSRWWAAGGRTFRTWTGAINQDIVETSLLEGIDLNYICVTYVKGHERIQPKGSSRWSTAEVLKVWS